MTGLILDAILMLLLVAALAYGVRLEKKLTQLRAGQLAFAGAVTELNTACGRAENALASLRASGEDADLLHDRILKARQLKTDLELLIARGARNPSVPGQAPRAISPSLRDGEETARAVSSLPRSGGEVARSVSEETEGLLPQHQPTPDPDDRAFRMAALAERIHGMAAPAKAAAGAGNVQAILHALTANQSAKQSLNRARASLDDDLFAA
ncbi:hypothetical protein MMB232_02757 [Brevundimonas subvibrioides]|uniref:DUF6468 domain-containing protein n=1 Tax=Brevundimonas subvibrioides TaxID=74313 RepID=UPI0032D59DFA